MAVLNEVAGITTSEFAPALCHILPGSRHSKLKRGHFLCRGHEISAVAPALSQSVYYLASASGVLSQRGVIMPPRADELPGCKLSSSDV